MSSRILRPGLAQFVEPIVWARVGPAPQNQPAQPAADRASYGGVAPPGASETQLAHFEQQRAHAAGQAYQRGFQEGEAASRAQAQAAVQPVIERLAGALDQVAALRPQLRRDAEAGLLKLAVAISRRILRRELTVDTEALRGVIQVALEKLQSQEICRVRIHPEQEPVLRQCLNRPGSTRAIEILADASLDRGALVFETAHGNLDASIETQLGEIERGLADRLQRRL